MRFLFDVLLSVPCSQTNEGYLATNSGENFCTASAHSRVNTNNRNDEYEYF